LSNRKTEQLTRSSSRGCGKAGNSPIVFRFSTNPTLTIQTVAEAKPKDPRLHLDAFRVEHRFMPDCGCSWQIMPGTSQDTRVYPHIGMAGAGSHFFLVRGVRRDRYRVYLSDDRRSTQEKWPRPEGLRGKSGHAYMWIHPGGLARPEFYRGGVPQVRLRLTNDRQHGFWLARAVRMQLPQPRHFSGWTFVTAVDPLP
jgi:hypothetical protein